ncbi:MAG: hypothetical protein K940chlam7_01557, partial [Chlamydiae bacterium]|nr:hypothetical protein [Chlamydiota bacterium]
SFTFTPPVPLTLHRGLAPFGATAPLKFYISFRCTNKTVEEDIFVEKNLCKTARTSPRTPKFIDNRLTACFLESFLDGGPKAILGEIHIDPCAFYFLLVEASQHVVEVSCDFARVR